MALAASALLVAGSTPARAQVVAMGIVTDEPRGEPVAEALITLVSVEDLADSVSVRTDAAGRFAALLPRPGAYALIARHLDYDALTYGPIDADDDETPITLFVELSPRPRGSGEGDGAERSEIRAVGSVTDDLLGTPVVAATVTLVSVEDAADSVVAHTDGSGRFTANLPGSGRYEMTARHLRYDSLTSQVIEVRDTGEPIELLIEMIPRPTELEGIAVEAQREVTNRRLEQAGFFQRKKAGFGTHLTPEDLENRRFSMQEVFRGIPGVRVVDGRELRLFGGGLSSGSFCPPRYFLNGAPVEADAEFLDFVALQNVAALEVFTRSSQVPPEYRGTTSSGCGVVLIWTGR
ncbi:MAG: carboxypeptidase-like regulatory domain-containing protein [Longimicrobiales bacterium]|nr:carboxypeptidase-like regulatory domain-containing protein [Longimicrobiales bacterium]